MNHCCSRHGLYPPLEFSASCFSTPVKTISNRCSVLICSCFWSCLSLLRNMNSAKETSLSRDLLNRLTNALLPWYYF
ncbi:hypothetical protein KSS87_001994, partial [Heliosperma pusillum]